MEEFDEILDKIFSKRDVKVNNPHLEYVIYKLLKEFDLTYMSKTRFFKLLYLIYQNLKNRGIDIKLPYFWYEHGPVVDTYALPGNVDFHYDGFKFVPSPIPKPQIEIESDVKRKIEEAVLLIKSKYEKMDTESLIDEIYSKYAPLKVQNFFRELLKLGFRGEDKNKIDALLMNIVKEFPKRDYSELYSVLLRIVPLVRYGVKNEVNLDEIEDLVKNFWKTFCQKLSLNYNENLPSGLVRMHEMYEENMKSLKQRLKDVEKHVLSSFDGEYEIFNPIFEKHLEEFLKSQGYI